jgi:phage terminase large subunit-like protein
VRDDATQYARDVVSGTIIAGKPVRLACERHIRDIDRQVKLGLRWDPALAQHHILFFEEMLTVEVDNEVKPFILEPFQRFIIGSLFGWLKGDGTRRFRTAYIEMGKGSGKSPLAAGIGVVGLVADGQVSPEVYSAAVTREQAQILWKDAKAMVERSPELAQIVETHVGSLFYGANNGVFRPLSSEHRGLDGKRVHMALVDEIHEHPTAMVVDKMRAGTKARRNALIVEITNSGSDLESVCYKHHEYSLKVLEGTFDDSSWFAYVCSLDLGDDDHPGDDWTDEKVWIKANPGLGTILPVNYVREQVHEALGMPTKQNIVKRLNCCIWTQQNTVWIPTEEWEACKEPIDFDSLLGQPCWAGLDLSTKLDLTCLALTFRRYTDREDEIEVTETTEDGSEPQKKKLNLNYSVDLVPFFYIPEDTMYKREKEDRVPYSLWAKQGFIFPTPGNVVDYDYIFDHFSREIAPKYSVQEIGYDPYNATQFALQLQSAGQVVVEVRQGAQTMSEPSKVFEALVKSRRIRHGGHPVMRWCVSNVAAKEDKKGNIFPFKQHERKRIDGVIAAIIGLNRMVACAPDPGESTLYTDHDLIVL